MAKTTHRVSPAAQPAVGRNGKLVRLLGALLTAAPLSAVHATLIDFDNLAPPNPPESTPWQNSTTPIAVNTYASQGVLIAGSYVAAENVGNSMWASNTTQFTFIGPLPNYVSFHLKWLPEDNVNIRAVGPSNYSSLFHYYDYEYGPGTPGFTGNETISFSSSQGISSVSFAESLFQRFPGRVDNLYFGAVPAVPEPASAALLGAGLLAMGWARRRMHPNDSSTARPVDASPPA